MAKQSLTVKVRNRGEVGDVVFRSGKFNPATPAIVCLFGGDRLSCIDEGIVFALDGDVVGLGTIAPEGEMRDGQPTIVGLYVRHEYRGRGYGRKIMLATIDRMRERGLVLPYRVDATSSHGFFACQGLPEEYRQDLDLRDMSMKGTLDMIMML